MSITFSVFPLKKEVPSFQEVLDLSTKKINKFLKDYGVNFDAKIEVRLLAKENNLEKKIELDASAKWDEDYYAWFSVATISGGTDSYYWELSDEEKSDNLEEFLRRTSDESRQKLVKDSLENKVEWNFRRSAGQLPITNIAYGFIASAFAELTGGFIYSDDGGWDYQIFPATSEEFDAVYFRSEKAISEEKREWAINCIENIY